MLTRFEQLPKGIKREIRQLAGVMHERLLAEELRKLEGEFARWRRKELDAFVAVMEEKERVEIPVRLGV